MKPSFSFALASLLLLTSCASAPQNAVAEPKATEAPSPNAATIESTRSAEFPMTAAEKKKLNADFKRALVNEERNLAKKEKSEMKAFTKDQDAKKKSWHDQEKKARRKYFEQHMSGPERREYIQNYLKRKDEFEKAQQNDLAAAKQSWKEKRDYLKKFQRERSEQFKASIDAGQRPSQALWPKE